MLSSWPTCNHPAVEFRAHNEPDEQVANLEVAVGPMAQLCKGTPQVQAKDTELQYRKEYHAAVQSQLQAVD